MTTYDSDDGSQPIDKYVSTAPLHLAHPKAKMITKEKLRQLRAQGYVVHRGRFTAKEDKRIKKNWDRICRLYPEYSDPRIAFCLGRPDLGDPTGPAVSRRVLRQYKKFQICHRLAYKLDNKLICDIYHRCKKLFSPLVYNIVSLRQLTDERRLELREKLKAAAQEKRLSELCYEESISPSVVQRLIRSYKRPVKEKHKWNLEEDFMLKESIEEQFVGQDASDIPTYKINFHKVRKSMESKGLKLRSTQISKRWHRLNDPQVGVLSRDDEIKAKRLGDGTKRK